MSQAAGKEKCARMTAGDGKNVRRRISFEAATFAALDRLARDRMSTIQDLANEAFRDLLKKYHRPMTLKEMLRESARSHPANDHVPARKRGA
jgi:hypothetical protein